MAIFVLRLLPFILLLLLHNKHSHANDQWWEYCSQNGSNAAFLNNLYIFFKSITTNTPNNGGYYNETVGIGADQVYGHALCYADTNFTSCTRCLSLASYQITRECPDSKTVSLWLTVGQCFIRYSYKSFFSVVDYNYSSIQYNVNNFNDPELGVNARNTLFNKLITNINASADLSTSGEENVTGNDKVYGLLQCTRDLNHQDCYTCLNGYIGVLHKLSYANSTGMRIYGSSCYLHYEMFNFMSSQGGILNSTAISPVMPPQGGIATKPLKKSHVTIIVAVVGAAASLLVVITISIWFQRKWCFSGGTKMLIEKLQEVAASEFLIYDLTTIRSATDNFSDENMLGRGGFGPVYKGTLPNCQEIAVKRLSASSTQGATEFKNEVELLVRLRHNNLVKLLGCCISEHERMLCYEYLPKGSLDNILFGTEDVKCKELEWSRRYSIIKGTCRGLLYLHEESPLKIVHCDFKANNILLDKDMNPKIADFGLAKLFDRDQTHTITAHIKGTFGYIAPESSRGTFSAKSDVYSFGILVLEIVTGRKNNSFPGSLYMSGLINYVWKSWSEGKIMELKDPTLNEECIEEVTKCIHIALLCLQENPSNRPRMETVFNMLNTASIASLPTLPPARFIWGADPSALEHDENVTANLRKEDSIVGVETAKESFLSSFNRRT